MYYNKKTKNTAKNSNAITDANSYHAEKPKKEVELNNDSKRNLTPQS